MIWSLVLAAGMSKRMGEQKLLLPFGGKSIIETVITRAAASRTDGTMVVLGSDREHIERRISPLGVRTVYNSRFGSGMLSSVQCGLKALPEEAAAAVLMLGDQPSVSPETIDKLIGAYNTGNKGILLPVFDGRRGHPVLIDLKYRDEITRLDPGIGLRQLIHNHPEDINEVAVQSPEIHQDIDRREDYMSEIKKYRPAE